MTQPLLDMAALCLCGRRRGQHRYGDHACPNGAWFCGNGQPHWWNNCFFTPAPDPAPEPEFDVFDNLSDAEITVAALSYLQKHGSATEEEINRAVAEAAIEKVLNEMADAGELIRIETPSGPMWKAIEPEPVCLVYAPPETMLGTMIRESAEQIAARL